MICRKINIMLRILYFFKFLVSLVNNFCKQSLNLIFFHSLYYNKKIVDIEIVIDWIEIVCLLFKNMIMSLKMLIQPILVHFCLFKLFKLIIFEHLLKYVLFNQLSRLKCRHKLYQMSYKSWKMRYGIITIPSWKFLKAEGLEV